MVNVKLVIERKTMTTSTNVIISPMGDRLCYEIDRSLQESEVREVTDQYTVSIIRAIGEYFEAQKEEATAVKTTNDIHPTLTTALPTPNHHLDRKKYWAQRSPLSRDMLGQLWPKVVRNA